MTRSDAYKTVISAFFSSRGYFTMMDQKLYGTEYHADVVAVLPIFKELQWRTQIGYAPCGILQFLPADGWPLASAAACIAMGAAVLACAFHASRSRFSALDL